jgi:hypothetical protein
MLAKSDRAAAPISEQYIARWRGVSPQWSLSRNYEAAARLQRRTSTVRCINWQLHIMTLVAGFAGRVGEGVMLKKVGIWIRDDVEQVFLILTAIVAIVFLAFSHLGLIDLKQSDFFVITLLCLIAICLFLGAQDSKRSASTLDTRVTALQNNLDQRFAGISRDLETSVRTCHDSLVSRVIQSVQGFEYRRFRDATEFLNYLAERILQARSVYDLTWVPAEKGAQEFLQAEQKYHSAILEASKHITYREIYVFCDASKYEKLKKMFEANPPFYHCRYYQELGQDSRIPRPSFTVIDNEEVLLYGITSDGVYCAVRHPRLVESFVNHYSVLWQKAVKLKEGATIYTDEYNKVMLGH